MYRRLNTTHNMLDRPKVSKIKKRILSEQEYLEEQKQLDALVDGAFKAIQLSTENLRLTIPTLSVQYFQLPTKEEGIAIIPKCGSSTLAYISLFLEGKKDLSKIKHSAGIQFQCSLIEHPKRVYALIRNPLDKFIAAVHQVYPTTPNNTKQLHTVLDSVREDSDKPLDPHFWPQYRVLREHTKLYKFPDHLLTFCEDIGFPVETIPTINPASIKKTPKPVLSQEIIDRVKIEYARDFELFESIKVPGQINACRLPDNPNVFLERLKNLQQQKRSCCKQNVHAVQMLERVKNNLP